MATPAKLLSVYFNFIHLWLHHLNFCLSILTLSMATPSKLLSTTISLSNMEKTLPRATKLSQQSFSVSLKSFLLYSHWNVSWTRDKKNLIFWIAVKDWKFTEKNQRTSINQSNFFTTNKLTKKRKKKIATYRHMLIKMRKNTMNINKNTQCYNSND